MSSAPVTIDLDYAPPLDWSFFLDYISGRLTVGVEVIADGCYTRVVEIDGDAGTVSVAPHPERNQLIVSIRGPVGRHADAIGKRVCEMFDLNADLTAIRTTLSTEPRMAALVAARPGLRVPGAWSLFELLVRTVVGQQVSVRAATTVMGRIVTRFGRDISWPGSAGLTTHFPSPTVLADGDLSTIGMPAGRIRALRTLARTVADKSLTLTRTDPAAVRAALLSLPGIGPWTVEYFALRGLRDPDAWPGSDLILKRAVGQTPRGAPLITEAWRPFRAYAAMHLWYDASRKSGSDTERRTAVRAKSHRSGHGSP